MVAIRPAAAARLLAAPPAATVAFLLFGPDEGRIAVEAAALAKRLADAGDPPGSVTRLAADDLAGQADRLPTLLQSASLFGDLPVVHLRNAPPNIAEALGPLLAQPLLGRLVVEAGNLKRDAKLRTLFEAGPNLAAIAFYEAGPTEQASHIRAALAEAGLSADRDALDALTQTLGGEAGFVAGEVAKLAAFAHPRTAITAADIAAVVGDMRSAGVSDAVAATLAGRAAAALDALDRLIAGGDSAGQFLSGLLQRIMRLHRVRASMAGGAGLDMAMRGLRPPVFFKEEAAFREELQGWPLPRLEAALAMVNAAIAQSRSHATLDAAIAGETILALAVPADRAARSA